MNQIHIKNRLYMLPALLFCLGLHGTEAMQQNITELNAAQSNAEVAPDLYNYVNEQAPDVSDTSVDRRHNRPNRPKQKPRPSQQFSPAMLKQGQPGTLDLSFGNGKGYVVSPIGKAYAVAVQPDGKILVGGSAKGTGSHQFCLARYTTDGLLDSTFGPGHSGYINTNVGSDAFIKAIAIQPDGHIVVGGSGALVRYGPRGIPDFNFGPNANGIIRRNQTNMQEVTSIIIQDDGKIIASGGINISQFGSNGIKIRDFDIGGRGDVLYMQNIATVLAQGSGKTIAAGLGLVRVYNQDRRRFEQVSVPVVMRHNSDGSLDTSFGPHGTGMSYVYADFEDYYEGFENFIFCVINNINDIVLAGRLYRPYSVTMVFTSSGHQRYGNEDAERVPIKAALARYNSFLTVEEPRFTIATRNRWLDLEGNFGNNGIAEIPGKENISATAISYAQNNKFVAVGFSSSDEFIVARYYN